MMDEERLRVTNSVNVSTALTWFAVLLITGAVSGIITIVARFITIGDKVTLEFSTSTWVFIIVITVAIYSLTLSIVFGGLGISATNETVNHPDTSPPTPFPDRYDRGNFARQVGSGIAGLLIGAAALVGLSAKAMIDQRAPPTEVDVRALTARIDKAAANITDVVQVEIRSLKTAVENDISELQMVKSEGSGAYWLSGLQRIATANTIIAGIAILGGVVAIIFGPGGWARLAGTVSVLAGAGFHFLEIKELDIDKFKGFCTSVR